MRARWYDPFQGRFISEDPIGLAGGINNYAYALNDPVNMRDLSGLDPCEVEWRGWDVGVIYTSRVGGCEPWFSSMIDNEYRLLDDPLNKPVPGSFCDLYGCVLRPPTDPERERVDRVLDSLRDDIPFCQQVSEHGRAAAARNLRFFDNAIFPGPGLQLFGNAPYDSRLGGPVMYLYAPKLRDSDIVHEAVHTVPRIPHPNFMGYPDATNPYYFTPLGSIDQTARSCMGG